MADWEGKFRASQSDREKGAGYMDNKYAVEMKEVKKSFGGIYALKSVDFKVERGECHGLIGENGAGKSTMMKILGGIIHKDEGDVFIHGAQNPIKDRQSSEKAGIAFVPQELDFISGFTVAENIFLGLEPVKLGMVNRKKMFQKTKEFLQELQIELNPNTLAKDLNVSQQQMMVIARILARDASIIIMDEPTARLGHAEIKHLLGYIKQLSARGKTIIYISHHLDEIMEICDSVTVLRDGVTIMTSPIKKISQELLVKKMVDREIEEGFKEETGHKIGDVMLKIENLSKINQLYDISFEARKGEVVGFFGLVGSGRTEAIRAMLGIDKCNHVDITLAGEKKKFRRYKDAIDEGIVLVPEERRKQGLILNNSVENNITLGQLQRFTKIGLLNPTLEKKTVDHSSREMDIICRSYKQKVKELSGGNQQKVVLAKYIELDVKVFILDEPTRGIDIGAKEQIYQVIEKLASKNMAVIVISSELPELQRLCDSVYVMKEGRITKRFEREELKDAEKILQYALN